MIKPFRVIITMALLAFPYGKKSNVAEPVNELKLTLAVKDSI